MADDLLAIARRFADLDARKKQLEAEVEAIEQEMQAIEPVLLDAFAEAKIASPLKFKMDDGTVRAVYLRRDTWARAVEDGADALHAALRRNDLGEFVKETVNTNTLSAWYREQVKQHEEIPPDIAAALKVTDVYHVRTRKG